MALGGLGFTLPETNMETQKGPYKDYSPSKRGLWVSMLVWGSVGFRVYKKGRDWPEDQGHMHYSPNSLSGFM